LWAIVPSAQGKRLQVKTVQIVMVVVDVKAVIWVGATSHDHGHGVDRQRAYRWCQDAWSSELRPCVMSLVSLYLKAAAVQHAAKPHRCASLSCGPGKNWH
jgi:hypothetical protein